ncbi:SOS response-associated peptidase [Rhizomonospora bruguierae]|uniref:SOS response-associated peptidase n=1 Tax=Rhizomonospora bruguierae TaxID=1581705 RepID=UPI001BCFD581|nr:SOS response-associated peptidase [Micromonospora sp. NBRC 107566]
MCGRYATTRSTVDLTTLFEAGDDTLDRVPLAPDYNVAPTDPVPIVRMSQRLDGRVVTAARWGLVPSWARDTRGAARMINARAETVATTRAYATSFGRRRCLVPADGWYEWVRGPGGRKQPYFMTSRDGDVLAFAGLWSPWGPEPTFTCTIVTMPALGDLSLVHHRMPLLLPRDRWARWLAGPADPTGLLAPPPAEYLAGIELRPVGPAVGDVRNDGPDLTVAVPAPPLGAVDPAAADDVSVNLTLF